MGPAGVLKAGFMSMSVLLCEGQWCVFCAFETQGVGYSFSVDNVGCNPILAVRHFSFRIILRDTCHQGKGGSVVPEKDGKYFSALTERKQGMTGTLELVPPRLPPDLRKQWELVEPQCDCRRDMRSVHLRRQRWGHLGEEGVV